VSQCDVEVITPWRSLQSLTPDATQLADPGWAPPVLRQLQGLGMQGQVVGMQAGEQQLGCSVRVGVFIPCNRAPTAVPTHTFRMICKVMSSALEQNQVRASGGVSTDRQWLDAAVNVTEVNVTECLAPLTNNVAFLTHKAELPRRTGSPISCCFPPYYACRWATTHTCETAWGTIACPSHAWEWCHNQQQWQWRIPSWCFWRPPSRTSRATGRFCRGPARTCIFVFVL
jgi:hypothetical protein